MDSERDVPWDIGIPLGMPSGMSVGIGIPLGMSVDIPLGLSVDIGIPPGMSGYPLDIGGYRDAPCDVGIWDIGIPGYPLGGYRDIA